MSLTSSLTLLFVSFVASAGAWGQTPQRIVALSPALAEITDLILDDQGERLVGVTDYADTPARLKQLPSVGPYSRFSIETVLSLRPDLILATQDGNSRDQVEHLRGLGKRVVVVGTYTVEDVARSFVQVGDALGFRERGQKVADEFRRTVETQSASSRRSKRSGKTVALQLGDDPLIFIGGRSFTGDLVQKLGFKQLFSDSRQSYPRPSREYLLAHPPDEIWVIALGSDVRVFEKMRDRWKTFKFSGGKTPVLRLFNGDDWVRPTPRLVRVAKIIEVAMSQDGP